MNVALTDVATLKPAPWNPRLIRDARFRTLCASIEADPAFMERRPILAMADGTIYAGNMRYRAAVHLGWNQVPAIVEDVPERLAKERAMRDNNAWREWQDEDLGALLEEMRLDGSDIELLGFDERLLREIGASGETADPSVSASNQYGVIVICPDEAAQREVYESLTRDGYDCKVVVT